QRIVPLTAEDPGHNSTERTHDSQRHRHACRASALRLDPPTAAETRLDHSCGQSLRLGRGPVTNRAGAHRSNGHSDLAKRDRYGRPDHRSTQTGLCGRRRGVYLLKNCVAGCHRSLQKGNVVIGELMGYESARLLQIRDLFVAAEIPFQLSKDIRRSKWEKMCWNCVFNPLTVLIDDKVSKALDHPEMMSVIRQIVGEISAVSAALKVPLPPDMPERVVKWTQEIRDIHTSMYDDWKAGRQTEIRNLNGYIAEQGRRFGVPTPVNEALTAMIKTITEKDRSGPDIVRIDGAVVQPVSLDRMAIRQLPSEHHVADVNRVMPSMKGAAITVKGLLEVPALGIHADHVTFHSSDGKYAATLTLQQAKDFGLLLYEIDGEPLPEGKGGPFRLITPGLGDLCANVKGVGRIEVRIGTGKDTRPSERPPECTSEARHS